MEGIIHQLIDSRPGNLLAADYSLQPTIGQTAVTWKSERYWETTTPVARRASAPRLIQTMIKLQSVSRGNSVHYIFCPIFRGSFIYHSVTADIICD